MPAALGGLKSATVTPNCASELDQQLQVALLHDIDALAVGEGLGQLADTEVA